MDPTLRSEFEAIVAAHSTEIFAYLWRMVWETQDAEDCLQETFLRAFRAFPDLRPLEPNGDPPNLRAWLYKIATNVARTHLKNRTRLHARHTRLDARFPYPAPDVQTQVDQRLSLEAVLKAVHALPEKQRAALLLRKYQGLSYDEIGSAIDSTPGAARANVYQALVKLRKQFRVRIEHDQEDPAGR